MKKAITKILLLVWLGVLIFLPNLIQPLLAQNQPFSNNSKILGTYIFTFTRYFEWPKWEDKKVFRIGVLSSNSELVKVLQNIAYSKVVKGLPMQIIELKSANDISNIEMLYIDKNEFPNFQIKKVPKNILVISKNERDLDNAIIAFVFDNNRVKFAYNEVNAIAHGLIPNEDLRPLAVTVIRKNTPRNTSSLLANDAGGPRSENKSKTADDIWAEEIDKILRGENQSEVNQKNSLQYTSTNSYDRNSKMKATYLYAFTKYFKWTYSENGPKNFKEFRIGIMGAAPGVKQYIETLALTKQVDGMPIKIVEFNSIEEIKNVQMLYLDKEKYPTFDITNHLPPDILLITENERNLFNTMIAFVTIEDKQKFAFNALSTRKAGLIANSDFESLAVSVIPLNSNSSNPPVLSDKTSTVSNSDMKFEDKKVESIEASRKWANVFDKIKSMVDEKGTSKNLTDNELEEVLSKITAQKTEIENQKEDIRWQILEIESQSKKMNAQREVLNKQQKDIEKQNSKLITQLQKINSQQTILYLSGIIVVIIIIFLVLVFRNYKKTKEINLVLEQQKIEITKKNELITMQKYLVEEKHREITDSINYAERIQRTFMATKELLDDNLKDYFVFFQPKDVVSGDFYWGSELSNGNFVLATADSTGHGVPGAIMSLLNIASLEKSIENEVEPAEILNSTRKIIIERLKKDGSVDGGKDGMDCSLVSFDFKNRKLTYSAAYNPVWIVRPVISSSDEGAYREMKNENSSRYEQSSTRTDSAFELIELDPDKMPVGKHDHDSRSFSQKSFDLIQGDVIYTLTDGFPDQFGGPKGKKFMYKKLKELLISISTKSMPEQKEILSNTLNEWKGDSEQVDDVCVIGVRV